MSDAPKPAIRLPRVDLLKEPDVSDPAVRKALAELNAGYEDLKEKLADVTEEDLRLWRETVTKCPKVTLALRKLPKAGSQ